MGESSVRLWWSDPTVSSICLVDGKFYIQDLAWRDWLLDLGIYIFENKITLLRYRLQVRTFSIDTKANITDIDKLLKIINIQLYDGILD